MVLILLLAACGQIGQIEVKANGWTITTNCPQQYIAAQITGAVFKCSAKAERKF